MAAEQNAFGVYVHWPFCLSKCPYCDFNSHVRHTPIDEERFVRAFAREIETTAQRAGARDVSSIFLGGGTPSLMRPETVGAINLVLNNLSAPCCLLGVFCEGIKLPGFGHDPSL